MIEDVMRVNIDSMLYSYQTVLRYMMKKKIRGSFLNFSSSTALAYNGSAVQGYPFSKACIKLATQNMVNQVSKKYGIRFNCLAPNYVWVPKQEKVWDMYREHFEATTPMPYVGMPEDAAWAVVYLCSDEAKYINGVCLPVDGGPADPDRPHGTQKPHGHGADGRHRRQPEPRLCGVLCCARRGRRGHGVLQHPRLARVRIRRALHLSQR